MRVAVVTGAASGIGEATASRLIADGWAVVGIDLAECTSSGVTSITGDTTNRQVLSDARHRAESIGTLEGWVNCAAIPAFGKSQEATDALLERVVQVNLVSYFWGSLEAIDSFLTSGVPGSIVNVSSIHGARGFDGWALYDLCKGGVDAMTRSLAVEFAANGIRCNAVAPGSVATPLADRLAEAAEDSEKELSIAAKIAPMGRVGRPEEIAEAIVWLLGRASFITGHVLPVDGGAMAWIPTRLSDDVERG
jgi:NAD(P)-dependent dehydrogenase (short-subunit alcohol dehydrogenase family)